ncbi:MAG TPA: CBS domain-containing protein [Deltaproteobacteria bacterium]|jgi:CBS domain-containing protein|nr:CBS domain-containing protein [Deltaproteobacteria bacterium]HOI06711.1 CBS domain-containing protein [Deltaproteobacteria bacterium]
MLRAKDIMTTRVITLSPGQEVMEAARILLENHINGAPVLDEDGAIIGVLTRDDLISQQKELPLPSYFVVLDALIPIRSIGQVEREVEKIAATTVEHAMTPDPVIVTPDTPIDQIAELMVDKKIHTIPVQEPGGTLAGVIGKEDLLRTIVPGQERKT